jgi:hypothetical protein
MCQLIHITIICEWHFFLASEVSYSCYSQTPSEYIIGRVDDKIFNLILVEIDHTGWT